MNAIAFIDSGVAGYATLVRAIKAQTKVVVLDSQVDGVKQITQTLQQGNYQQVHLISHGSPGCLDLGNSQLSLDTLGHYASRLQTWFSMSPRTLLIYGCNVAAGDAGAEFIVQLQQLTGANIAASASLTGNAAQGGNWDLEVTTAPGMDLDLVIDEKTQLAYQGVLETYTVTTTDDENDGSDSGAGLSLREAIALSNENEGEDIITFDSSLSGGAIALTQTEPNGRGFPTNQDLDITDSVNIVGLGAKNLTIDGLNRGNGIFSIGGENTNVNLEGLTIANGDTTRLFFQGFDAGGAIDFGGANLTLKDSVIFGSDSTFGGAITNSGHASIINSTITDNFGYDDAYPGGAIYNTGTLEISNSTISNNLSRGIANRGTLEISNSTISNNFGGGVFNENSATFTSSIIANNTSSDVTFTTVTPGTNTDDDVIGTEAFTSGGNNLIGRVDGFGSLGFNSPTEAGFVDGVNGDVVGTTDNPIDPQLGELQDNGGPTLSQELLAGSPAIDAGSNPNNLATDQRGEGFNRTVGNGTDIGAFEVQDGGGGNGGVYIVTTLNDEDDGDLSQGDISLREAILNSSEGDTITFDSNLSGGTITLSLGQLLIDKSLTIEGLGSDNLTIDANDSSRVFNIDDANSESKINVAIDRLKITGGNVQTPSDNNANKGGGIFNQENLTLADTTITDNKATEGGGIYNLEATTNIIDSHVDSNSGSGIYNYLSKVNISNSSVNGNDTGGFNSLSTGINADSSEVNIVNSTVSGNLTSFGGSGGIGVTNSSTMNIEK
jgi:CSLREA domain-containing protein